MSMSTLNIASNKSIEKNNEAATSYNKFSHVKSTPVSAQLTFILIKTIKSDKSSTKHMKQFNYFLESNIIQK